jgi:hypothetical protein
MICAEDAPLPERHLLVVAVCFLDPDALKVPFCVEAPVA